MLARLLFWPLGLVFLAATIWRIAQGDWSVVGVIEVVVLALLAVATFNAAIIGARFDATVEGDTVAVTTLRTRRLSLEPPTMVTIYLRQNVSARGILMSAVWRADFERPGELKLVVSEPYERDFPEFVTALQPALREHPELAANAETRGYIEDPASMAEAKHSYGKPKRDPA